MHPHLFRHVAHANAIDIHFSLCSLFDYQKNYQKNYQDYQKKQKKEGEEKEKVPFAPIVHPIFFLTFEVPLLCNQPGDEEGQGGQEGQQEVEEYKKDKRK